VATAIQQKLSQGIPPKEIAVLYRVNGQSEALESALAELNIDYQVRGGERYFSRRDVQSAIQAVRAETVAPSSKPLALAVSDIVRSLGWTVSPPEQAGPARERWEALNSFLDMVQELPDGATIFDFAKELEERARSSHEPQKSAVTLATIHSAKGLEWDVVYLIGANEGYLPISYAKSESDLQEERRLLYVAITRARKELAISYADADAQTGRQKLPSRFLVQLRQ
jgi:DNA helicase-2/ATP-dependent DNA helicase PcrA